MRLMLISKNPKMEKSENKEYSPRHIWVSSRVKGIGDSWYRGGCDEMTPDKLQKLMEEHNATAYYEDNFYDNVKDIPFKPAHREIETFGMPTGRYTTENPTVTVVPRETVIENPLGYSNTWRFKFPKESM